MTRSLPIPLLRSACKRVRSYAPDLLRHSRIVCVQHLLGTTEALCASLLSLGARPDRLHFLGKPYSTCLKVAARLRTRGAQVSANTSPQAGVPFAEQFQADVGALWNSVAAQVSADDSLESIIIVDDGGYCLAGMPRWIHERWPTAGVEVTTSGLRRADLPTEIPIVEVASSAAKLHIEAPMISKAVFRKLRPLVDVARGGRACGVVGLGSIGRAVAADLTGFNNEVFIYDRDPARTSPLRGTVRSDSMVDILARAEYIFGCTGEDVFAEVGDIDEWLRTLSGTKTLISCSSGDSEFRSLLNVLDKKQHRADPLATIQYRTLRGRLTIVRGGFPANFDGSPESVPAPDIQMTLGLWIGGVVQAKLCQPDRTDGKVNRVMLDPYIQNFIIEQWLTHRPSRRRWYSRETLDCMRRPDCIRDRSSGAPQHCDALYQLFGARHR